MSRWQAWKRRVLCEVLAWHRPIYVGYVGANAVNALAVCSRCGYLGMLDSQGNLF